MVSMKGKRKVGCMFLLPFLFILLSGQGCPPPVPPTDDGNGTSGGTVTAKYVGDDACVLCRSRKHESWLLTAHASALDTLKAIGQDNNSVCLACHTVGFGDGGFVDETATPHLAGVQCENCHGAAGEHTRNVADESLRPTIDLSADLCGKCHTDYHHPTFDEWELSKHAESLAGLRTSSHAGDSCLECHSQDYRHAVEEGETPPTVDTAQLSLVCVTCHSPHGGTGQSAQLRLPIADLCGECHTQEEATLGDSPHHPQLEMLTGIGAFDADGSALSVSSTHGALAASGGRACATCHVVQHEVEDPSEADPVVTGHTFNPFDESITEHQADQYTACLVCHNQNVIDPVRKATQNEISNRLTALAVYFDSSSSSYIDPSSLSAADQNRLDVAEFNYSFVNADGSRGVHNPVNARQALDIAESIVNSLSQ